MGLPTILFIVWLLQMVSVITKGELIKSCYQTEDGGCYEPLTQGPCPTGHWLVAQDYNVLVCEERKCGPEEVFMNGKCESVFSEKLNKECLMGEAVFLNARAEAQCDCKYGWGRKNKTHNKRGPTWSHRKRAAPDSTGGRCLQMFTPGFCSNNRIMAPYASARGLACMNNPCGDISETLPHFSTWNSLKRENFTCHKVKKYTNFSVEEFQNCEVMVDEEDGDKLRCALLYDLRTVARTCRREECCGKGRIFSKYRRSCVRKFIKF